MRPTIPNKFKNDFELTLIILHSVVKIENPMDYHTAQMDLNLNQTFVSCVTGKEVPYDVWDDVEPNNWDGIEPCVSLTFWKYKVGLIDAPCPSIDGGNRRFVCQVQLKIENCMCEVKWKYKILIISFIHSILFVL